MGATSYFRTQAANGPEIGRAPLPPPPPFGIASRAVVGLLDAVDSSLAVHSGKRQSWLSLEALSDDEPDPRGTELPNWVDAIETGVEALLEKDYGAALLAYRQALQTRPDDSMAAANVARLTRMLASESNPNSAE